MNQTYKKLSIPHFHEVFVTIDEVMQKMRIPFYLIGASAVALELLRDGDYPIRGTKDIDFAIMISSLKQFDAVVGDLESRGFAKVTAPWTLYHSGFNVVIDLLPFGEIEEYNTINFDKRYVDLHILGFKEVMAEAKQIEIEESIANIPPLHGMIILKLIAWSDRPEDRDNDLKDILLIISKYFSLESDEIFDNHSDAIDDNFEPELVAARVLGRKAGEILNQSQAVKDRILTVLEENTSDLNNATIATKWAREMDWTVEKAIQILNNLKLGISELIND